MRIGLRGQAGRLVFVRSFTLWELLVVILLIIALGTVSIAGYLSMSQAVAVTTGANALSDALNKGRQDAMTQNITVEVRLYAAPTNGSSVYRALQLHSLNADGTTPPLRPPLELPVTVVMDATATHSSLIAANDKAPKPDPTDRLLNGQTRTFHFFPDGSTDLDPTAVWSLTVRAATQSDPAHFPANWACLVIDPPTGRVQIYRP